MLQQDKVVTMPTGQPPLSGSPEGSTRFNEQGLDQHIDAEHSEIAAQEELAASQPAEESTEEAAAAVDGADKPVQDDAASPETEVAGEPDDENAAVEEPEGYAPNTKYKVLDKEYEFDPKLHSVLNAETEPVIRGLYEKSQAFDGVKVQRDTARAERDQVGAQYQQLGSEVQRTLSYLQAKDYDSFFEAVKMPVNEIAQWLLQKAEIEQLPPEQKAVYTEREMLRRRMNALENNFQNSQATNETQAVQARITELDGALQRPENQSVAGAFEARNGAGSFKKAVMAHAASEWHASKKDLTVAEAIQSFTKTYGLEAPKATAKPAVSATNRVVAKPKAKTIPNLGKSQASVTAEQKPKSIEDLKKYAKAKYG